MEFFPAESIQDNFTQFYKEMAPLIFAYLFRLCNDRELAEELLQETFFSIYKGIDSFQNRSSLKTWAYTIATNKFRDFLRKKKNSREVNLDFVEVSNPGPSAEKSAILNQDIQRVREIIQELPPELRTTLMLVRFEGMKYREAAEVQGLTLSTVRMQIHRSIQIIWERLKEN